MHLLVHCNIKAEIGVQFVVFCAGGQLLEELCGLRCSVVA